MAWRNTNPSDYAPKSNAIGEALTGFASVYAPAKIAKDKREADIAYEKIITSFPIVVESGQSYIVELEQTAGTPRTFSWRTADVPINE